MNEIERLKKALIDDPGTESTAKSFGVLIPIIETPHGLSVLFEVRARNLRRQPGEICFPGGSTMEGKPTPGILAIEPYISTSMMVEIYGDLQPA